MFQVGEYAGKEWFQNTIWRVFIVGASRGSSKQAVRIAVLVRDIDWDEGEAPSAPNQFTGD